MNSRIIATDEQREVRRKELEAIDKKEANEEKDTNFLKYYFNDNGEKTRELIRKSPNAAIVLSWLADKAFDKRFISQTETGSVACTLEVLKEECMIKDNRTVKNALKYLETNSFISIVELDVCTVYCINPNIYWRSSVNSKHKAFFGKNKDLIKIDKVAIVGKVKGDK